MELRHLKYFVAVAEELNFSRAAIRLYISQPTLSRQIKNLEDELNIVLFLRQSDGLTLTAGGKFFLEQAKDILHRSHVAVQTLKALYANTEEPLVIGYISTILQSFLGETLHCFGQVYPQVAVRLQEMSPGEQVKALRSGAIDIAFIGNSPSELEAEFVVKCVKRVPVAVMLPITHRFADRAEIRLIELAGEKFIGLSKETFPRRNDFIREFCQRAGFTVNLHIEADSLASMIALVAAGQGVAVIPSEASALPHPRVVFVPIDPVAYARSTAMWRKETPTKSLDKYLTILFEHIQD